PMLAIVEVAPSTSVRGGDRRSGIEHPSLVPDHSAARPLADDHRIRRTIDDVGDPARLSDPDRAAPVAGVEVGIGDLREDASYAGRDRVISLSRRPRNRNRRHAWAAYIGGQAACIGLTGGG